jgi:hypothetical protein
MNRRLFLKTAVSTCGVVAVGLPNLTFGTEHVSRGVTEPDSRQHLRLHGDPSRGCAVPGWRRNFHDNFPQDPGKFSR